MIAAELRARQAHQPGGDMTPTDDLDNLFLTVTCPTCSVGPGERCTIRRGPPDRTAHLARQDRAVRADRRHADRQEPSLNSTIDGHHNRMREVFGLRAASGNCPKRATGRRCTAYREEAQCICVTHHHILDHPRVWRDDADRVVYTAEPYGCNGEDLAALVATLEPLGLRLRIRAASQWYPGSTVLLWIVKATP